MSSPDHVSLAQRGFAAADRYERARPGYPEDAVGALCEALGLGPSRCVMDLAAGTGKLTAALEATGARVVAVEPLDAMRGELQRRLPTVTTVAAYAEELPYADGSFDAVTVAQAFHWFDGPAALREVRRVLRPAGGFGLVWNVMDRSVAWVDALQELIHQYRGSSPWYAGHGWRSAFTPESGFDELRHESFANLQQVDADAVVDRVASISFIATLPDRTRSDVLAEARRIADAAGAGEPGFAIPYVTDVFVATRQE